jgi:sensor c-di-GMP phosphodiesterase-like protein
MPILGRRRLGILSLALLGTLLGASGGFWLGRAMLLRAARHTLADYGFQLVHHGDELSAELTGIFGFQRSSDFPYCSDQEISAMQAATFHSRDLKDIGRTRNGILYCSAFLGRLAHPYVEGPPTLVLPGGAHVYTNVAVVLASFDGNRATVVESGEMDAVLSPAAFDRWDHPHVSYLVAAVNRATGQVAAIAGSPLAADPAWVLSGESGKSGGTKMAPFCAVTAESIADVWGWSRAMQVAYSAMGGLAGFSLALALAIFHLQKRGLSYQLQCAIRNISDSLYLVYQPIVDVQTRRCVGAEALLRWNDQDGKPVSPDVFIRLAEDKGFIADLTAFVVRLATQDLGELLRRCPELTLSINIAASDLVGDRLFDLLEKHVARSVIRPSQIALELTERSTADLAMVRGGMQRLNALGYKVHIDDFGTGFSSLSYLDKLSVDAIKIDRAFTQTIGTEAVIAPILPQMLAMVESLGIDVVIEGVETEAQMRYLESTEKPLRVQGWYCSKPLSAEAFAAYHKKCQAPRGGRTPAPAEPVDQTVSCP